MQWGPSCVKTSSLVFSNGGWMRRWLVRLFPAVDLGLGGPKAACQGLPALPRGLPALAQGQQAATTAAPHRPIQKVSAWVHSSSLASQLSRGWLWLSLVCTCDQCEDEPALAKARLAGHRRCRQRCQDAKNLPTTHPTSVCQSTMKASSIDHPHDSYQNIILIPLSPSCSQGVPWKMQKWIWREMESSETCKSNLCFFSVSVQDFLEKAKKVFEEKWVVNPKVSGFRHQKCPGLSPLSSQAWVSFPYFLASSAGH